MKPITYVQMRRLLGDIPDAPDARALAGLTQDAEELLFGVSVEAEMRTVRAATRQGLAEADAFEMAISHALVVGIYLGRQHERRHTR